MKDKNIFEIIIIGGSYSGLSAAMSLGRSMRDVLVIDNGKSCNRQTPYSHNFITQDGEKPEAITEKAKIQVLNYDSVKFVNDLAVSGRKTKTGFEIITQRGIILEAKKLVFATGITDISPDIEGFEACWGISIIHCPYCHGYEFRSKNTGILANGARAFHLASMVYNLTNNITIFTGGVADFNPEQIEKLNKHNITIVEKEIVKFENKIGHLRNIILKDGNKMPFEVVYASIPFVQHSDIPAALGCEITELNYLKIDPFQKTNIDGVYACGDNSNMMRSVANAVHSGNLVGAVVNGELTAEQF